MFDLGIWELLTVAVLAVVVLKPEDLPEVVRTLGRIWHQVKAYMQELCNLSRDVIHDTGYPEEYHAVKGQIVDLEGNLQDVYEVDAYDVTAFQAEAIEEAASWGEPSHEDEEAKITRIE